MILSSHSLHGKLLATIYWLVHLIYRVQFLVFHRKLVPCHNHNKKMKPRSSEAGVGLLFWTLTSADRNNHASRFLPLASQVDVSSLGLEADVTGRRITGNIMPAAHGPVRLSSVYI